MHERSRDEAAGGVETTPPPPPLPPQPSSSSSKRGAYFLGATVPADGDEDDEQETFPASPALDQSGSSSIVQAVSSIRRTFSESVLDVEPPQRFCYVLAACACLNSCNLGYDVGSVGGAALLMREQLGWSAWDMGFYVGSINFFCILGALNAGYICDRFGRRLTFTFSCIVFISGLLIQVAVPSGSQSFAIAMVGRTFVGIGVGLGLSIDPLYISEISPPSHRGHLVSFSEIAINFGIMLGFIADFSFLGLPDGVDWRTMLGLGILMPSILLVLTLTVMPESPRWLLMQGRHDEAIAVLKRTYPLNTDFDALAEEIASTIQADFEADHASTWHTILRPSPVVVRMLLAGVGLAACQQLNGSESLVYFSPEILRRAGFVSRASSFGMTILIGLSKMLFTLVAVLYVDHAGRRPLLLLSTGGLCVCLLLMAAVSPFEKLSGLMVFAMCAYMAFFSVGIGPLTWVGATEVFSTRIRAKAMSLSVSTNRLISGVIASATLPLLKALRSIGYFALYAALTFGSMVYLYLFFPETKGRTLEQVEHHFEEIVASKERREAARHAAADAAAAEDGATTMNGSSHKGSDADLTEK